MMCKYTVCLLHTAAYRRGFVSYQDRKTKPDDLQNPYDPDCTDYDDFFEGMYAARDKP